MKPSSSSPIKVLITGFGPFPGVQRNPCQHILADIKQATEAGKWNLEFSACVEVLELETAWRIAPKQLAHRFLAFQPDMMIHLGYAAQAAGFRLEQYAHNKTSQHHDQNCELPPSRRIIMGAPARLESDVNLPKLVRLLHKAELPAEISQDAGRYLCNQIYFHALSFARTAKHKKEIDRPVTSLFVHIPPLNLQQGNYLPEVSPPSRLALPDNGKICLTSGQLLEGLRLIVQACAAQTGDVQTDFFSSSS